MTSVHKSNDIRIFIKQCQSLSDNGYETHYIVPNTDTRIVNGINIHSIDRKSESRLNRMLVTTRYVYKKALEINADVYHFHDPELIPVGLKLKRKGKKVIYDVHEDVASTILSKTYINKALRSIVAKTFQFYENYAVKRFDYIFTATPFIAKRLKKQNSKTLDINNYPILKELYTDNINHEKRTQLCYVGGITINRGILEVIKASNNVDVTIKLAGPIFKPLQDEIEKSKNLKYLSILNREEVKELLEESLAGIVTFLPEPNHINAQPNKMFEYMSAGIAVIGSDFPLWKNIIEGNDCGLCINPESSEEIKEAIQYMLNDKERAIEMGKNGRKAIEEKYNWEQEKNKLIKVYNELLKGD